MRDILLGILIPGGLLLGLFSAPLSVLVLNWICFQRPHDFSYGLWNTMPLFQIAFACAFVSNLFRGRLRPKFPPILIIYLLLLVVVTLSAAFAYRSTRAWQFYMLFVPSMAMMPVLLFATIHDLKLLKSVVWVAAGGLGINAFKTGVALTVRGGGHLTDQIDGFVGDNNVFGLALCLVVAILMGLSSTLPKRKLVRLLFYTGLIFVVMCIIYTKSRGALLSLGVIMLLRAMLSQKPMRNVCLVMIVGWIGYMTVPDEYFDRLSTLKDISADTSAMGRVENWGLAWQEALENPGLGVGPDNHVPYNRNKQHDVQVRVAHSVYFQVLGELGFTGFFLYLLFVGYGLWILRAAWRELTVIVKSRPDLNWARDLASWMTCGYIGYIFGSALLNMFYVEFPWYVVFFGAMLRTLVAEEMRRPAMPESVPARLGRRRWLPGTRKYSVARREP